MANPQQARSVWRGQSEAELFASIGPSVGRDEVSKGGELVALTHKYAKKGNGFGFKVVMRRRGAEDWEVADWTGDPTLVGAVTAATPAPPAIVGIQTAPTMQTPPQGTGGIGRAIIFMCVGVLGLIAVLAGGGILCDSLKEPAPTATSKPTIPPPTTGRPKIPRP